MATLMIGISALVATAGVGQISLAVTPVLPGCLPYLDLDKIEIWAASVNNRASATKVGETGGIQYVHSGLAASTTRYYWARARNKAGTIGDWYPLSATGGVSATTSTTAPGPNSVGSSELQDNAVTTSKIANAQITTAKIGDAQVTNAKIDSLSASKISAGTISASVSMTSPTITGGLFQTSSGSTRVEISGSGNYMAVYTGGSQKVLIGTTSVAPTIGITGHSVEALNALGLGGSSGHGARFSASSGGRGVAGLGSGGGGFAYYSEAGGYGPFTGSHDGLLSSAADLDIGDIVVDVRVIARSGVDDTVTEVARSSERAQRNVIGILSRRVPYDPVTHLSGLPLGDNDAEPSFLKRYLAAHFHRVTINSVGEGQMNVCGRGGNIAAGDWICTSDMPGKGERQNDVNGDADDFHRRCTVAKAREAVVFDFPDQVKRVACTYHCG